MYGLPMELYQLRTFIVVAEEKNVTKAAKRLYTTPPSVSTHIKALESELDVKLFVRTPSGMEITEKGKVLKEKAENTLAAAQDLVNYATEMRDDLMGSLNIGISGTMTFLKIPDLFRLMKENSPGIELNIKPTHTRKIVEELLVKTLDVGYIFGPSLSNKLTTRFLCSAELAVAVPKAYEEQARDASWETIVDLPWITSNAYCAFQAVLQNFFEQKDLKLNQVIGTDDEVTKAELVTSGVGLALLEKGEAEQLQAEKKLHIWETNPIRCDLFFAYLTKRNNDPLIQALESDLSKIWNIPGENQ